MSVATDREAGRATHDTYTILECCLSREYFEAGLTHNPTQSEYSLLRTLWSPG